MNISMDLNASPLPEEDEGNYGQQHVDVHTSLIDRFLHPTISTNPSILRWRRDIRILVVDWF